jgi:hypothetical protein
MDFVPPARKAILAHIGYAHSGHDGKREGAIDQTSAELGAFAVFIVEVNLICVVGQQREPDVVVFPSPSARGGSGKRLPLQNLQRIALPSQA